MTEKGKEEAKKLLNYVLEYKKKSLVDAYLDKNEKHEQIKHK